MSHRFRRMSNFEDGYEEAVETSRCGYAVSGFEEYHGEVAEFYFKMRPIFFVLNCGGFSILCLCFYVGKSGG